MVMARDLHGLCTYEANRLQISLVGFIIYFNLNSVLNVCPLKDTEPVQVCLKSIGFNGLNA